VKAIPFALVAALLAAGPGPAQPKKPAKLPEGYVWEKDFEQAKLKAAAEGKLLYVDFYTDW
jgi:hypothetical protein